tara:strand:+ start:8835 stop:9974 length:1140 start_codon:yes stop_codon:yes gene_type:complete
MRIYKKQNVFNESLDRIRYLFDEFENVVVSFSGGKDSTVTLYLALMVAEEKNRLPLKVMFLDQEAEWQAVIDYMEDVFSDPRIDPMWLQIPFKIFNASSNIKQWITAWEDGVETMRPRNPMAITENVYGTDRFYDLFSAIPAHHYKGKRMCFLGGVRAEESPRRYLAMTEALTYKDITWGKRLSKKEEHYTFYPIYDWSYTDVWKSIHDNDWPYTKVYDYQYMHGVPIRSMRVSNLHHETALQVMEYLQEVEVETWVALTKRMSGINTAGKMKKDFFVKELPFMFKDWREYRDYLTENLVQNEDHKKKFFNTWNKQDKQYADMNHIKDLHKAQINTVLTNDVDMAKLRNFTEKPDILNWKKWKKGITTKWTKGNKYIYG